MTPLFFRKSPGTLLVNPYSCKCHEAKLVKKSLLLTAAEYHQPESTWYLPPLRSQFLKYSLHRALQDTKPAHVRPRLAAGFGREGVCILSPGAAGLPSCRIWHSWLPALVELLLGVTTTPFSQHKTLHLQETAALQWFCQQEVVSVLEQISSAPAT